MIEALSIAEIFIAGRKPAVWPELLGRPLRWPVESIASRAIALARRRHSNLQPARRIGRIDHRSSVVDDAKFRARHRLTRCAGFATRRRVADDHVDAFRAAQPVKDRMS